MESFGENLESWASGGKFELLCHCGILWRECGKLCQWKTVGSCFAIVEFFGENVVNCASGGRQLEVALPLLNSLEKIL